MKSQTRKQTAKPSPKRKAAPSQGGGNHEKINTRKTPEDAPESPPGQARKRIKVSELLGRKIGTYARVRRGKATGTSNVAGWLKSIKEPSKTVADKCAAVAEAGKAWAEEKDPVAKDKLKDDLGKMKADKLSAASPSGVVTEGGRKHAAPEGRWMPSGVLQVDLDAKDNEGRTAGELVEALKSLPFVFAAWVSPSGNGAKGLAAISRKPEDHLACHKEARAEVAKLGLVGDDGVKDPVRLCYSGHDPDLWIRSGEVEALDGQAPAGEPSGVSARGAASSAEPSGAPAGAEPRAARLGYTEGEVRGMLEAIRDGVAGTVFEKDGTGRLAYAPWVDVLSGVANELGEAAAVDLLRETLPEEDECPPETGYEYKVGHRETGVSIDRVADIAAVCGWDGEARGRLVRADFEAFPVEDEDAPPLHWPVKHAHDIWTDDPEEIAAMSAEVLVDGLLRRGEVLLFVGGAKTWKTWFALHMAISLDAGAEFAGAFATRKSRVLCLDYELKPGTLRKRLCMLAGERPESLDVVSVLDMGRRPTIAEIKALVVSGGYDVVFIDPLAMTGLLSEENSNDSTPREMLKLLKLASDTGAGVVIIDHTAKGGGKDRDIMDAARGASAKGGIVDDVLQLLPFDGGEPDLVEIRTRTRDFAPSASSPVVRVARVDGGIRMELTDYDAKGGVAEKRGRKILAAIDGEEPMSVAAIAAKIDESDTATRAAVRYLARRGLVESTHDPDHAQRLLYRAAEDEEEEPWQKP